MDPLTVDLPENKEEQENTSSQEEKKKIPWFPIVVILVTVLIVFVAAQREGEQETDTDTTDQEGSTEEVVEGDEAAPELPATTYVNTDAFEGREQAEYVINSTQSKAEGTDAFERVQSGIVADSELENTVYFATYAHDTDLNDTFVGVYKYDTVTYRWHRLYKNTYKADGDVAPRFLRVVGKQGGDLVLFMDALDSEFDSCDSYWLIGAESSEYDLLTLNIEDSLDGPQAYEAPSDLLEEERAVVTDCKGEVEETEEDDNEDEEDEE